MAVKIFVAGHKGMVGSALYKELSEDSEVELITSGRAELDLLDRDAVTQFLRKRKPDQIYCAAARVGGIHANSTYPADFIFENLQIQNNLIHEAWKNGINKLLFLGSSCIYPREAKQPIHESELLSGPLEPTNEPYAIAKIAGIKLCESYNRQYGTDYRCVMPTNLYGPNDNFHPENSHVMPALIRRFSDAVRQNIAEVVIWGSGKPKREFLHVQDMARACVFLMSISHKDYSKVSSESLSHVNIGTGEDCSIADLASLIAELTGYRGSIVFDTKRPDGTPRKLLDVSRINSLGWSHTFSLREGVKDALQWYEEHQGDYRQ